MLDLRHNDLLGMRSSRSASIVTQEKLATVRSLATTAKGRSSQDAARAEELIDLVQQRKERITDSFYDIGVALREIFTKKLHLALGYSSFDEMLRDRNLISPSHGRKLIQIVKHFARTQALKVGPEKAYAVVRYAEVTEASSSPRKLLESGIRIEGKPMSEATAEEVMRAASSLRARTGAKRVPKMLREAHTVAGSLQRWLKKADLADVTVGVKRAGSGYRVRIELDVDAIGKLFPEFKEMIKRGSSTTKA